MRKSHAVRLVAAGAVAAVVGAYFASTVGADEGARGVCNSVLTQAREYGAVSGLARAETAGGQEIAAWQEQRNAAHVGGVVSPLRTRGLLAKPATVCVFKGQFVTPSGPPPPDGSVKPPHDVLTLLVLPDGNAIVDSAGYESKGHDDTPSRWRARPR